MAGRLLTPWRIAALAVLLILAAASAWIATGSSGGGDPHRAVALLTIDRGGLGKPFHAGTVGLAVEAYELGQGRLTASHRRLVRLMRLLGPATLQIGGGTVDRSWWKAGDERAPAWAETIVTAAALRQLRGLLDRTGWRAVLGVDLAHFDPARAAGEARSAARILGPRLLGMGIGNEPDRYPDPPEAQRPASFGPGAYLRQARRYRSAIHAAAPAVAVLGPGLSDPEWLPELAGPRARSTFSTLTLHYYPTYGGDPCEEPAIDSSASAGRRLLSPVTRIQENNVLRSLAEAGRGGGLPVSIPETNSVPCPPEEAPDPGPAAALWSFDWSLRAAAAGVRALDFQGHLSPCSNYPESPICAPGDGEAAAAGEVTARPVFYGMLAAAGLAGGRFAAVEITPGRAGPLPKAQALVYPSGAVKLALENLTPRRSAPVLLPASSGKATIESLVAGGRHGPRPPTLGDARISTAGRWTPRSRTLPDSRRARPLEVPPYSVSIVTLR